MYAAHVQGGGGRRINYHSSQQFYLGAPQQIIIGAQLTDYLSHNQQLILGATDLVKLFLIVF